MERDRSKNWDDVEEDVGLEGANAVGEGGIASGIFGRVFPSLGSGSGVPSTDDAAQRKPKRQRRKVERRIKAGRAWQIFLATS